jgi:hypothetical protein
MELHFPHLTAKKQRLDSFRPLPPEGVRNLKEYFDMRLLVHHEG